MQNKIRFKALRKRNQKPTLGDYIIAFLSMSRHVKRNEQIWSGLWKKRETSKKTVGIALTRLHKQGYIQATQDGWTLTPHGKNKAQEQKEWQAPSSNSKESLLVCFDIPENQREYRDWLRGQLKLFNYQMVQRSIWRGPGPLPPGFYAYLKEMEIFEMVHVFRLAPKQRVLK
ncbi:MAG: hypothetical protein KBC98_00825 [Candidatus Pacebacteria bacterium]|jgi:DNA-binding transcriptional regulator PaaX|nr:hypothetical protein [Candidatus Paceibacterota bacterium]